MAGPQVDVERAVLERILAMPIDEALEADLEAAEPHSAATGRELYTLDQRQSSLAAATGIASVAPADAQRPQG